MSGMRRATLAEQAYEELEAQIVSGRLAAGQRLLTEELASRLAISQTPVKEALALLERDGLVRGSARRTSVVRRFTTQDITEIYDARTLLEVHGATVGMLTGRADATFAGHLQSLLIDLLAHVERGTTADLVEAIRLDRAFHEALVSLAANGVMTDWHRVLLRQTQTIRSYSLERYDITRARGEHAAIIAAVLSGQVAAVELAVRDHLERSRAEMLSRPPEHLPPRSAAK